LQREVDPILDKISAHAPSKVSTAQEREILEKSPCQDGEALNRESMNRQSTLPM